MALPAFDVLSLCAGGGGLDLGIRLVEPRARVVAYVEREAFAASVLVARMADAALHPAPIWDDVGTFDGRPWRGLVDGVVAGFPCQPWSVAGKRRGADDDRWLWPHVERIVREVEPVFVFLENVPALRLGDGLGNVLGALAEFGFDVEWMVLGADQIGAPHHRRRLFILAHTDAFRRWAAGERGGQQRRDRDGKEGSRESEVGGGMLATSELSLFPPGPDDVGAWGDVLESHPTLAPSTKPDLHGMADGMAARLVESVRNARLSLLGNGVVPLAAAVAWRVLMGRALEARGP